MTNLARKPGQGGNEPAVRDIVVEDVLPQPPDKVWKALTTAELIGRWLMPNDFEPVVGKRFTFTTRPIGAWDGVVQCEVLEVVPLSRLVYSWKGGADDSRLDSVVTWTLRAEGKGTRLRMVHAGFRSPQNDFAYGAMGSGWRKIVGKLGEELATL
ncbi:MAG: SRPBCC domain-containing protein [Rhodospirillales bacterium]|nr:SRPBCC domain-containing protein [Rhodospirillales bacterium]